MERYMYIIGICFITVIFILVSIACFVTFDQFKPILMKLIYHIKRYLTLFYSRVRIVHRLWKVIDRYHSSNTIESIFALYTWFYEKNYNDMENWQYIEGIYTKNDLMQLYRWITYIRPNNFREQLNIIYDQKREVFEYWGSHYQSFKSYIDKNGELHIVPIDVIEGTNPFLSYTHAMLKLQNSLYDLDTQKAQWIIERRKYFNI